MASEPEPTPRLMSGAVAGQFANGSNRRWRNETRPQQSVSQQVGQPLAVADVRLLAWHCPHVLRVNQQERTLLLFKNIEDWPPVHASRLERDVSHAQAAHPGGGDTESA